MPAPIMPLLPAPAALQKLPQPYILSSPAISLVVLSLLVPALLLLPAPLPVLKPTADASMPPVQAHLATAMRLPHALFVIATAPDPVLPCNNSEVVMWFLLYSHLELH